MSGASKYSRIVNMLRFWISRITQCLPIFVNMTGLWVCVEMQLWKGSEYAEENDWRMPELTILAMAEFWICLVKVLQGFENVFSSKHARTQKMVRLWICEGDTGYWICLNKPEYALIMLNMPEYACTYLNKQNSEYAKILNVSDAVYSIRSL